MFTFFQTEELAKKQDESIKETGSLHHKVDQLLVVAEDELEKLQKTASLLLKSLDNKVDAAPGYKENLNGIIKDMLRSKEKIEVLNGKTANISSHDKTPESNTQSR